MTFDELRQLRVHEPDALRAERVRERCLAVLAQRRREALGRPALGTALLVGFSVCYLLAIIRDVLQLHAIR